ncbi:MAG TPA: 3-phenylpropionate/cinnamic acid dioxygenase subunit beta [Pseudonocardia sp.]|uniref:3-phenylpropionate/cinnamic acid dioxygenase subunit beta n=1 Tax=Pseudonocardia sp. TaxID=60912 RepID=UPI002ED99710
MTARLLASTRRPGTALPFSDERHLQAHQFLVDEAYLLDGQDYPTWLSLLTEDIRYLMPVRVTTARGADFDTAPGMAHFDEDKYSLGRRVARFATEHAWTEDPPSRLRHYVTNVRTFATVHADELLVESAVLLFRAGAMCGNRRWSRPGGRTCCAGTRPGRRSRRGTGCWPGAPSRWTSRCCACRTWRSSYERRRQSRGRGR